MKRGFLLIILMLFITGITFADGDKTKKVKNNDKVVIMVENLIDFMPTLSLELTIDGWVVKIGTIEDELEIEEWMVKDLMSKDSEQELEIEEWMINPEYL